MGRFGIQFSDENNTAFKITKRKKYVTHVNLDKKYAGETKLDRAMAWFSYYAMVFVAICVFNQPAAAYAFETISQTLPQLSAQSSISDFQLRGTL